MGELVEQHREDLVGVEERPARKDHAEPVAIPVGSGGEPGLGPAHALARFDEVDGDRLRIHAVEQRVRLTVHGFDLERQSPRRGEAGDPSASGATHGIVQDASVRPGQHVHVEHALEGPVVGLPHIEALDPRRVADTHRSGRLRTPRHVAVDLVGGGSAVRTLELEPVVVRRVVRRRQHHTAARAIVRNGVRERRRGQIAVG